MSGPGRRDRWRHRDLSRLRAPRESRWTETGTEPLLRKWPQSFQTPQIEADVERHTVDAGRNTGTQTYREAETLKPERLMELWGKQ